MLSQAGLAGLAAAVPGGIRDCGVRAVDRLESLLRRWAAFGGEPGFRVRVLLVTSSSLRLYAPLLGSYLICACLAHAGYCL